MWRTLAWCTWFSGGNEGAGESLTGCKGRTIKNCLRSGEFYSQTPQARNNARFLRNKNMLFRIVFF